MTYTEYRQGESPTVCAVPLSPGPEWDADVLAVGTKTFYRVDWFPEYYRVHLRQFLIGILTRSDEDVIEWARKQRIKLGLVETDDDIPEFMR